MPNPAFRPSAARTTAPGLYPGPARPAGAWEAAGPGTSIRIAGIDQTHHVRDRSLTMRLNTFDFALGPDSNGVNIEIAPQVGDSVQVLEPAWDGTVVSVTQTTPPVGTATFFTVTCSNTKQALASPARIGMSDVPDNASTYGYRDLRVTRSMTNSGPSTKGSFVTFQQGLWPAMTFTLTSANQGLAAAQFTVSNVTVTWPTGPLEPVYSVEFGDAMVTLSAWSQSQLAYAPDGSISGTKITDGTVTTPKLAANAVIANVANVGGTVTIDSTGITLKDAAGASVLTSAGFSGSWADRINSGIYNNMMAVATAGALTVGTSRDDPAGRTSALPYWTVWRSSGSGTATVVADATWPGGNYVQCAFSATGTETTNNVVLTTDLSPILPFAQYRTDAIAKYSVPAGVSCNGYRAVLWYDAAGSYISTVSDAFGDYAGAATSVMFEWGGNPYLSPGNARFARVEIGFYESVGHSASSWWRLGSVARMYGENGNLNVYGQFKANAYISGGTSCFFRMGSTAFPVSPQTNDQFYRTDLGLWCYYDGTRWLTCQLFTRDIAGTDVVMPQPAASGSVFAVAGVLDKYDTYVTEFFCTTMVNTTNNVTNYYTVTLKRRPSNTTMATFTTSADTAGTFTKHRVSVGALGGTTDTYWAINKTATGAPGTVYLMGTVTFRLVIT